ncbi:flagellar basal body rod protein FlgC [Nocardioides massiliensis]|uniref:Flagellar basal-body rod protein FlgC n=1 Tax=Nocardioides massiliensis TaxID=1325935 RepID=A0ABT9NNS4_9ACTN|nr:flagellar basal body rod C-terminal domain-containing protein [Nocardioides massiliensis]MDP9821715.1 flagellar basal-body rod protein FlgC [Nocardioides massiliensis]
MSAFHLLGVAGSSLGFHQTWLDALAHNIANVNTVRSTEEDAFQAQMLVARSRPGGGVEVAGIVTSDPDGRVVHQPDHPLADADGNVRLPEVDMPSQMSQLVMAQRGFQASVSVTKNAQDVYTSALQIGRQ